MLLSLLLLTLTTHITSAADEICCCPDLNIALKCSGTNTSVSLETNGFRCVALSEATVTLECNVADIDHPAILSTKYQYYKTYELESYKPVAYQDNFILLDCPNTATCNLTKVSWLSDTFSTEKFALHDNFLYQCLVEVTLIDGNSFNLSSNTMWLDVLYNIQVSDDTTEPELKTKNPLNTDNPYERLLCDLPNTNPPTKAVWFYQASDGTDWTAINIPEHPRMALVDNDIADESSGSFEVGTLVIMIFEQSADSGLYRCDATYSTPSIGTNTSYSVSKYSVSGDGQEYSGTPEVKMISAIRSEDYTTLNGTVDFTCYARDTDARDEDLYQWVYENPETVNYESVNLTQFEGIEILNSGRTLRLPSQYRFYDIKFKCKVTRTVTKMSDEFKQPVMVPETLYPPSNFKTCVNSGDNFELYSNQMYMMSDKVEVAEYEQKLPGVSYRWFINGKQATAFSNIGGGSQNETYLKMFDSIYTSKFNGDPDGRHEQCIYFAFIQTHSTEYQLIETLKLTRLNKDSGCYSDLSDSVCQDQVTLKCDQSDQSDPVLTVTLASESGQCVSIVLEKEGGTLATKTFEKTAALCTGRDLSVTFTKEDTQEETLSGNYTVFLTQEGTRGCSKTIDIDAAKDSTPDDNNNNNNSNGTEGKTFSCPNTYSDESNTPWTVNATQTCVLQMDLLKQFGVEPSTDQCYKVGLKEDSTGETAIIQSVCSTDLSFSNLTHESAYELSYSWNDSDVNYNCTNMIQIRCSSSSSSPFYLSPPLLATLLAFLLK